MLDQESNDQEGRKRTERNVMINIQRHLLPGLDFVDTFQDGQSMPDTVDAHFLQFFMLQRDEGFAHNSIFCDRVSTSSLHGSVAILTSKCPAVLQQTQRC